MITRDVARPVDHPSTRSVFVRWGGDESSSNIPANAIYASGEPIPDPSGTGYLTYEV